MKFPYLHMKFHFLKLSDEDESLYMHDEMCFNLQEEQMYRYEIDINQRDIDHWKEETHPEEMSFLVSAAKRQRSEVKISKPFPAKIGSCFEEAKAKEVESWLATSTVCRILRHQVPTEKYPTLPVDSHMEGS